MRRRGLLTYAMTVAIALAAGIATAGTTATATDGSVILSVTATAPVGSRPLTPVIDEATGRVFVANSESVTVTVVDGTTLARVSTVRLGTRYDDEISDTALDSRRGRLFVLVDSLDEARVAVLDTATARVVARTVVAGDPQAMVLDAPRGLLHVLSTEPSVLTTISSPSGRVVRTTPAPKQAYVMTQDPRTRSLYLDGWTGRRGYVAIVDPRSGTVTGRIPRIDDIAALVLDPRGKRLYIPLADDEEPGTLVVADTATKREVARITVGMWPGLPVLDPPRSRLYLATANADTITVIDTVTNTTVGRLSPGRSPSTPAVDSERGRIMVSAYPRAGGVLVVYDAVTGAEVGRASIGSDPGRPAIDSSGRRVYVTSWEDSTLTLVTVSDQAPLMPAQPVERQS